MSPRRKTRMDFPDMAESEEDTRYRSPSPKKARSQTPPSTGSTVILSPGDLQKDEEFHKKLGFASFKTPPRRPHIPGAAKTPPPTVLTNKEDGHIMYDLDGKVVTTADVKQNPLPFYYGPLGVEGPWYNPDGKLVSPPKYRKYGVSKKGKRRRKYKRTMRKSR